ncbi:MAG TPA: DivIVA domain-containing protein [Egibacteraceae bacterium]|nr:DivIVA domain-containing protein [Egibacteraceae bacterium]
MSLTREDVEQQVFKERFRGYDQDEVDRFLDRVADRISELIRECDELTERNAELARERDELADQVRALERRTGETSASEKLLQRTLVSAQRAADDTIAEARATAEQTVADARQQAEEIIAEGQGQVEEDARRARETEQRALQVLARVRRVVDDFARFRTEYREQVEAVIVEQLAVFDRIGDLPELPDGLVSLTQQPDAEDLEPHVEEVGRVSWEHGREM